MDLPTIQLRNTSHVFVYTYHPGLIVYSGKKKVFAEIKWDCFVAEQ